MRKTIFILLFVLGLMFITACEKKSEVIESNTSYTVTEEEWNNSVKDYAFLKDESTKLEIKIYTSIDEEDPDYILCKNGLVYKFSTIVNGKEFITYGDFKNNVGYRYYGINCDNYYKIDIKDSVENTFSELIENFNFDFNEVEFKNNEYVSNIPYEGKEKHGYYSFVDGVLKEFNIIFENNTLFKMTIDKLHSEIVLPNVNYINKMSSSEMVVYLNEALKELSSYNAVSKDYKVDAYEHYTLAEFEYLRIKKSDDTYKTLDELLKEIKKNLVDTFFDKISSVVEQIEPIDEYMWFGMFKDGDQNGLIIKLKPEDDKLKVVFAVVDQNIFEVMTFKEYLENRLVEDPDEDEFSLNSRVMIDTKDCLLIQYKTSMVGEYEQVLDYALTCIKDNGYEWESSGSSSDYHYEILSKGNKAVKIYFTSDIENTHDILISFCISFNDNDPISIVEYGTESPLFE